jgi:hypothetical protein
MQDSNVLRTVGAGAAECSTARARRRSLSREVSEGDKMCYGCARGAVADGFDGEGAPACARHAPLAGGIDKDGVPRFLEGAKPPSFKMG